MISVWPAGARMVRLRMRFCLAPTSSSPSIISTARSPLLANFSWGTSPLSETSVTWHQPWRIASSSVA